MLFNPEVNLEIVPTSLRKSLIKHVSNNFYFVEESDFSGELVTFIQENASLDVVISSITHQETIDSPKRKNLNFKFFSPVLRVRISEHNLSSISKFDGGLSDSSTDNVVETIHLNFELIRDINNNFLKDNSFTSPVP